MVSRVHLHSLKQDSGEGVRNFAARVRGQADICKFSVTGQYKCLVGCAKDTDTDITLSYRDHVIKDVIIRGLDDQEIQEDVLGHENQDMNLESTLKLIEAKESGKQSTASLLNPDAASAISQYRKGKPQPQSGDGKPCGHCGNKTKCNPREKVCPAFGKTCSKCGKKDHFAKCCRSKPKPKDDQKRQDDGKPVVQTDEESSADLHQLLCGAYQAGSRKSCDSLRAEPRTSRMTTAAAGSARQTKYQVNSVSFAGTDIYVSTATGPQDSDANSSIILSHHIFSDSHGWEQRNSLPHPTVTLRAGVSDDDYAHFNRKLRTIPRGGIVTPVADTGCMSCLMGVKIAYGLGFKKKDFIPVKLRMNAINTNKVEILGAILLRLSGRDKHGTVVESAQICYVTSEMDKFYISRETCINLGIISEDFPAVGEMLPGAQSSCSAASDDDICNCPERRLPPTMPTSLPFPATEDNVPRLKRWLLNYYSWSTFNTCRVLNFLC